jgi:hypothetical protein
MTLGSSWRTLGLEAADLLRERWLCQVEPCGSPPEMPLLGACDRPRRRCRRAGLPHDALQPRHALCADAAQDSFSPAETLGGPSGRRAKRP